MGRPRLGGVRSALASRLRRVAPVPRLTFVGVGIGFFPGGGGTQGLPRLIGPGRAAELILSGRAIGAEEAGRLGIAERFVPHEPVRDGVLRWPAPTPARAPASVVRAQRGHPRRTPSSLLP